MSKILVIGAGGQIGTELVLSLRKKHGEEEVVAADIKIECPELIKNGPYVQMDVLNRDAVRNYIIYKGFEEVYLLAALLSATAEKNPDFAWKLNMEGLFTVLNLAKEGHIKKLFWPSSIAVFGPTTPKSNTGQITIMEPSTVYGISKLSGERWCEYYYKQHGVDVRSIRYPGLISYKSQPGGGTTDYAVDIYYKAKNKETFTCFLDENTTLPMMFMEDAIRATIELMEAPKENLSVRSAYNIAGLSFTPKELHASIESLLPDFKIQYAPDYRQKIADSWPDSIDDSIAKKDWNWSPQFDLDTMTATMLEKITLD